MDTLSEPVADATIVSANFTGAGAAVGAPVLVRTRPTPITDLRKLLRRTGYMPTPVVGKKPVLDEWPEKQDTNDAEISLWPISYRYAKSTGLLTCRMPAFDIDIKDPNAAEEIEQLVHDRYGEHGKVLTRFGATPKRAVIFRSETLFKKMQVLLVAPNGTAEKPEKLELLADGQQLVGFGIHKDTHLPYRWIGGEPGAVRRDELPLIDEDGARQLIEDAAELLISEHGYRRITEAEVKNVTPVNDGRHWAEKFADDQYRAAGRLPDIDMLALLRAHEGGKGGNWHDDMLKVTWELMIRGHTPLEVRNFVQGSCKGGFDDPEIGPLIDKKWQEFRDSGLKIVPAVEPLKPITDPIDLWATFDPPALPLGLLPDVLERFALDQGADMGADPSAVAAASVAVCAAAIADGVQLQVKRNHSGWLESARIWVTLVGPSSGKKTPIIKTAARPLQRIDSKQAKEYTEARSQYERMPKEEKAKTEPPKNTRSIIQDVTIEAVQEILKDSPDGVLCLQDELSGWFGSMDKYSAGKGSAKDRAFWLEAFNGGPYSAHRIGRGSVYIENLSVSLVGGIQPELIRRIANDSVDDGLLQRLLPLMVRPATVGQDRKAPPSVDEYAELITRLNAIGIRQLRFDDGAQEYRQELEGKHLRLQQLEGVHRKMAAHFGKYDGIFARLCIVWHCVETANGSFGGIPDTITEGTARRVGTFLHDFLMRHALSFYAGELGYSDDHDAVTHCRPYPRPRATEGHQPHHQARRSDHAPT